MTTKFERSNKKHVVISCSTIKLRHQTTYRSIFRHIISRWWLHGCRRPAGVIIRICSGLHIQWSIVRFQAKTHTPILHWTTASARTHDDREEGGGANKHISRHFFCKALRQRHRQGPFFSARDCTFLGSGLHKIMSFGTVHLFSTAPLK